MWQYSVKRAEIDAYLARPEVRRLIPRLLHFSATNAPQMSYPGSDKIAKLTGEILDAGLKNLVAAYRAGVRIATGSDAGNPNIFHGAGLLLELEMFVRAGLTPVEAIHCATGRGGEHLGRPGLGTIAPGCPADLLLVRGDASQDIRALYGLETILFDGREIERNDFASEYELPGFVTTAQFGAQHSVMTDRLFGGQSEATVERGEAWHFKGEVRAGRFPYSALTLELSQTGFQVYDATAHVGLRFKIHGKAPGLTVAVGSMSVRDYDIHSASVAVAPEWRTVDVPFAGLKQQGFGKTAPFDPSRLRTVQFMVGVKGSFELWIRDLEFYR
jgi:hypothetical protein